MFERIFASCRHVRCSFNWTINFSELWRSFIRAWNHTFITYFISILHLCVLFSSLKGNILVLLIVNDTGIAHSREFYSTIIYGIVTRMLSRQLLTFEACVTEQFFFNFDPICRYTWWSDHHSRFLQNTNIGFESVV